MIVKKIKRYLVCGFVNFLLLLRQQADAENASTESRELYRSRSHIDEILKLQSEEAAPYHKLLPEFTSQLKKIYHEDIKPMEDAYKFNNFREIGYSGISDAELDAKPMILFLGPWSGGKTSIINYFVGADKPHRLQTGAEPVTSEFTILMHGEEYNKIEGLVLVTDSSKPFGSLEKYGKGFMEHFTGIQMPSKILEKVTFVDTPGIIENRKQQERGYPFNEVSDWFIQRADLILVVFDPTKLDIGTELESIFDRLKGHESQIRIIFNKADNIKPQELMRVYGALFWSLAPLIQVTEPPKVYVGSFWDEPFKPGTYKDLFLEEEKALLTDINNVIINSLEHKVATMRKRAITVRIHALLLDRFLAAFEDNKPSKLFGGEEDVWRDIVLHPDNFNIIQSVIAQPNISRYDIPDLKIYQEFFKIHDVNSFKPLASQCSMFGRECFLDKIQDAIFDKLPRLLSSIKTKARDICDVNGDCTGEQKHNVWKKPPS